MLTRQGLILNQWALRDTNTGRQDASAGEEFQRLQEQLENADLRNQWRMPGIANARGAADFNDYSSLDFLKHNSVLLANLKPDKDGVVRIDLNGINNQQELLVVAVDHLNTVTMPVPLKPAQLALRENRMVQSLDVAKAHSEQKLFTVLKKGDELTVKDITTSEVKLYDSLQKAYLLMATLSGSPPLTEFNIILTWPDLNAEEKRKKY